MNSLGPIIIHNSERGNMIRKILVVTLLVTLNNTASCMLLVPQGRVVKSRTIPANLRIAGRNKTPNAIALLPLARSGHQEPERPIVPSCTITDHFAQLRVSDDVKLETNVETNTDQKNALIFDHKQLQNILHETKAQLLLVLFLSVHSNVDKDTWAKAHFDSVLKKRDHPDIFAMLSNFAHLTTCRIENDQWYSSSISMETPTVRRWIATALIEIAIALDAIIGKTPIKARQSKAYEFFSSQLVAYKKFPDFSHKQSPTFDEDQLLLLLQLNKSLMDTCFAGKLEYQTSKHDEMLSYCETDCPTMNPKRLQKSFEYLKHFKMSLYGIVVQYVADGRYDA